MNRWSHFLFVALREMSGSLILYFSMMVLQQTDQSIYPQVLYEKITLNTVNTLLYTYKKVTFLVLSKPILAMEIVLKVKLDA